MRPAMARFEVVAGRALGMSILLDDELLIGRHAEGAGRLADDEEISRSHARISLDRSGFCAIEDLGSTNGTFVNGLRVASPQTLSLGDTIELGGTTLVVRDLPVPKQPLRNAGSAERPAHDATPVQRQTSGPEAERTRPARGPRRPSRSLSRSMWTSQPAKPLWRSTGTRTRSGWCSTGLVGARPLRDSCPGPGARRATITAPPAAR